MQDSFATASVVVCFLFVWWGGGGSVVVVSQSRVIRLGGRVLLRSYMEPWNNPFEVHANWEQIVTPVCCTSWLGEIRRRPREAAIK